MKVLYIGPYRDGTGYGHAAVDYISALHAVGVDLVIRPLKLNNANPVVPDLFKELESKPITGVDAVIQHCLPSHMSYNKAAKQIGMFATETSNFIKSGWTKYINQMDAVIVFNQASVNACLDSGVNVPVHVVPHACDTRKYVAGYPIPEFLKSMKTKVKFYWIGEFTRRKNLAATLKAFHTVFDKYSNAELIIKTNADADEVGAFCNQVKEGVGKFTDKAGYKSEWIISEYLTDEQMMGLHAHCDVYVTSSYGEAWDIPCFDAMAMGNKIVCPATQPYDSYVPMGYGYRYSVSKDYGFGLDLGGFRLYSNTELVNYPSIIGLSAAMEQAYYDTDFTSDAGMERAYDFSYEVIGEQLKEIILHA